MSYLRFGHLLSIDVAEGNIVEQGAFFARLGKGGNVTAAHLHYDMPRQSFIDARSWYGYTKGLSLDQVFQYFENSEEFLKRPGVHFPVANGNLTNGYGFGQWNKFDRIWHPGSDINRGSMNQDLGDPIFAPIRMKIVHIGRNVSGWGNICIAIPAPQESPPAVQPPKQEASKEEIINKPKEEECMSCKRHSVIHDRYTLRVTSDEKNRKYFVTSNKKKERWSIPDSELLQVIEYFDREIVEQSEDSIMKSYTKDNGNWSMLASIHKYPDLSLVEGQSLLKENGK